MGLAVADPSVFPVELSSRRSLGHSRSDLFYVFAVLVVTQPEVCSKTHGLFLYPSLSPFPSLSLSSFYRSLAPFFGGWGGWGLLRKCWQCVSVSKPIVELRHVMWQGEAHWTLGVGPLSLIRAFNDRSFFPWAVLVLDMIPALRLVCWDVVCKPIASILRM